MKEEEHDAMERDKLDATVVLVCVIGIITISLYALHNGINGLGQTMAVGSLAFTVGAFLGTDQSLTGFLGRGGG